MSPPNADGGSLVEEARRAQAAPRDASSAAGATTTILIVDDDPVIRSLMQAALEDEGYAVIEAADGAAASALCRTAVPALLVVDAIMPNMDGFALCEELRRHAATQYVPILMATGLDDHASIAKAYDAGASDFIAKPLNWLILSHRIRYMLRGARALAELRQSEERLRAAQAQERETEAQIAHLALHDALTELPNRALFRERLVDALHRVPRGERCAVLCLDLDQFKGVNDTLGHPIGDALLKAVTERLRRIVRQTDTIARLGGDEFAIVQSSVDHPADATALATRLIRELGQPFEVAGHQVVTGASIGIAIAPGDGMDPDMLLKSADIALHRAKSDGRNRYRYFEPEMDAQMQARRELELDLRKAIQGSEFELFFQPLVNLAEERITGFEALLRWNHPTRGMVSPAEFIPLAEEIGLIVQIGEWVLAQACKHAASWPEALKVAVNISAVQFKGRSLVSAVTQALHDSGLDPKRLELEITESVMVHDFDAALAVLHQLKTLGVSISMDDFGTGYSSLSYLRAFPFDKIKIDQSFVRELGKKSDCTAIIRAVTGMCDSLGITATAEGVETAQQLSLLHAERCTEIQGYLVSKPRPARDIPELIGDFGRTGREALFGTVRV